MEAQASKDATRCRRCALAEGRTQVVLPDGPERGILAIGEAPGASEDVHGVGFIGLAGKNLDEAFEMANPPARRNEYARTNIVRCRPPGNRKPVKEEMDACSGWLEDTIRVYRPTVLVAVGRTASERLVGGLSGSFLRAVEECVDAAEKGAERGGEGCWEYGDTGLPLVVMPHTSPLSWNRWYDARDGERRPVKDLGRRAVAAAVLLSSRLSASEGCR